ncbi:DUF1059 domain-containing protein [Acidianus sp. HS-5]|uniref:DUF1059 domain-containing protein n=1 Tax=Acidianus sp. HS-5 TaxID=2886040 RepID=UPI001F1D542D|nr:DUF1059 domain-containing protein [Acidianus sp. HS-5]BDC19901.1 small metal-binding protein [Acidianus sp. HS-5]
MKLFSKKKYYFECKSIGMNCGFQVKGSSSEEELLEILKIHAKLAHGISQMPEDLVDKIKQNVKKI